MKYFLFLLSFSVQAEVLSIKPKAYYDGNSGKMVYGKTLEIENGKIKSVDAQVTKKTLMREDLFLLPGLFDCHTHVFLAQKLEDVDFEKAMVREKKLSKEARLTRAKKYLKEYLNHGFTSLCDLGNSGQFLDVDLREQVKADINYPDFYVSGPGLATERGQFYPQTPIKVVKEEYSLIDDKTDLDGLLTKYKQKNVDILKIYMDNSPGKGNLGSALLSKILKSPLIKDFKKVTFHAIAPGSVDTLLDLKEVSIEHGDWSDWSKVSKGQKVYFTMTDQSEEVLKKFNYYNNVFYTAQVARAKRAYKENVRLVFGTDFYFDSNEFLVDRGEFAMKSIDAWKAAGISNNDILKAMTVTAAESLKLDHVTGKIEKGFRANLILVKENPLEKIDTLKNVQVIINKGQIYKLQKMP